LDAGGFLGRIEVGPLVALEVLPRELDAESLVDGPRGPESEARAKAQALALRVLADRLEHDEADPNLMTISFSGA
jgi:hypothetical protein